jgi:hypothetical protein
LLRGVTFVFLLFTLLLLEIEQILLLLELSTLSALDNLDGDLFVGVLPSVDVFQVFVKVLDRPPSSVFNE